MKASAGMPRRGERAQSQQVSALELGRMVGLQEAGLSYSDIAALIGHAAMTSGEKRVVCRDKHVLDHIL